MEIDSVFLEIGESGRQQVKYVAVLCLLKVRDEVYIWWDWTNRRSTPPFWWSSTHLWGGRPLSPAAGARRPWPMPALTTRWPPTPTPAPIPSQQSLPKGGHLWKPHLYRADHGGRMGARLWPQLAKQGRLHQTTLHSRSRWAFTLSRPPCPSWCLASSVGPSS